MSKLELRDCRQELARIRGLVNDAEGKDERWIAGIDVVEAVIAAFVGKDDVVAGLTRHQSSSSWLDLTRLDSSSYDFATFRKAVASRGKPARSTSSACAMYFASSSFSCFPLGSTQWTPREFRISVTKPSLMSLASLALRAAAAALCIHRPSGSAGAWAST